MTFALNSGIAVSLNNTPTSAAYASGGAATSTSVVISTANSNIKVGQKISGTGFAANSTVTNISGTTITFSPAAASQISGTITFSTNWYHLTDHNRSDISITPLLIEKESRMANGTLRKFVVNKKDILSVSWDFLPTSHIQGVNELSITTVDGKYGAGWITAFYNANHNIPIYIKVTSANYTVPSTGSMPSNTGHTSALTAEKIYQVFITGFSSSIRKRTKTTDYVDITLEFTEI